MTPRRIYNFSSGPCTLPLPVLEQAAAEMSNYQGTGMGIIEMSHRTKPVMDAFDSAAARLAKLLGLPANYKVLFLPGGATMQFGMIPLNLLQPGDGADYTHSGAWAKKAIADAKTVGANVKLVFDGTPQNYMTLPTPGSVKATPGSVYLHLTSNETIGGLQWKDFPQVDVPLVADMSSDFLSRPVPVERFGLIYAGAQKNIGPAGVCVVILRNDLLERAKANQPKLTNYLSYVNHAENDSMLNTPPVFQVYMIDLVLAWLEEQGGLAWAQRAAAERSQLVYDAISAAGDGGFYDCPVDERYRSTMNVVFRLPSEELEKKFVKEATAAGLDGLKGHRSVGGCRASLYNAMPLAGAQALADFMREFARVNG